MVPIKNSIGLIHIRICGVARQILIAETSSVGIDENVTPYIQPNQNTIQFTRLQKLEHNHHTPEASPAY